MSLQNLPDATRRQVFVEAVQTAHLEIQVQNFIDYKPFLERTYRSLKRHFGRYTYIEFAFDLGFSRTNVIHRIIKGKRPLTPKAAGRIAEALELGDLDHEYFTVMVEYRYTNDSDHRAELFKRMLEIKNRTVRATIAQSQLTYFSEWFHPVVREMMSLKHFKGDPTWIATKTRPRIRKDQAQKSLDLLEELGLIEKTEEGHYQVKSENVSTGDEVRSIALTRYHYSLIDMAKDSLTTVESRLRDISSVTIAINPATMKEIKAEIQDFRKKLLTLSDKVAEKNQVYQVNFQMFPLTY